MLIDHFRSPTSAATGSMRFDQSIVIRIEEVNMGIELG